MSSQQRIATAVALATTLVAACGDSRAPERTVVTTSSESEGVLAGRNAPMAALVDSADAALRRGDTTASRGYVARAAARSDNDPATWYRLGRAAEQVGDVGRAATAYRGYLASPPPGADTQAVRERLTNLLFGAPPAGVVASAPAAAEPTAPTAPTAAAAPTPTATPRRQVASARPATTPRRRAAVRRAPAAVASAPAAAPSTPQPTSAPSTVVASAEPAPVASEPVPQPAVAPPAPAQAEPVAQQQEPSTELASAPALPPLPPRSERVDDNPPHKHWPWTAMQHWLVARMAALGGTGGAIVGAIIGNVPGAIALGSASGAAAGFSKVEREKRDSARVQAARTVAARRVVRDSAAGEVELLDTTTALRSRRDSTAVRLP